MLTALERMGRDDITVYGFRSIFRDYDRRNDRVLGAVAEAALGHVVGDRSKPPTGAVIYSRSALS
jgi:hypothetical protein